MHDVIALIIVTAVFSTLIAEGVENKDQSYFVKELECDYVQGFFMSKPLIASDFLMLLDAESNKISCC